MFRKKHEKITPYLPSDAYVNAVESFLKDVPKGNNLISSIKNVIFALEKNITDYNWTKSSHCNCGLMVQAILGTDKEGVHKIFCSIPRADEKQRTWQQTLKNHCGATGIPSHIVFKTLYDKGFRPEDIVHLEYLNNKAILEVSKIDISEENYYTKKTNLIKYLQAWLLILEKKDFSNIVSTKGKLEAELLIAVGEENYSKAASLRDELIKLA